MDNFDRSKGDDVPVDAALENRDLTDEQAVNEFKHQCARVRDGCNFDISKCFKDGKPLIIDGSHVDPECYLSMTKDPETGTAEYKIRTDLTAEGKEDAEALLTM